MIGKGKKDTPKSAGASENEGDNNEKNKDAPSCLFAVALNRRGAAAGVETVLALAAMDEAAAATGTPARVTRMECIEG